MFAFPLSEMVGGIFYEHGHRKLATIIGIFTLLQAIWICFSDLHFWLKRLGFIALATVILQGIFGGITVLFYLPPAVSMIHGILAQTFFIITIIIAYSLSNERNKREEMGYNKNIKKGSLFLISFVYFQLILGALMRHTASGLAIPDFPTMGGLWFPTFSESMINNINVELFDMDWGMVSKNQVIIHFMHRLGALIVSAFIGYFFYNGGNDSADTAFKISKLGAKVGYDIKCIAIPKTVDNDLALTDCCPGFGSVAKYIATSTQEASLDLKSMADSSTKVLSYQSLLTKLFGNST